MSQLIQVPAYIEGIGTSGTETVDRFKGLAVKRTGSGILSPVACRPSTPGRFVPSTSMPVSSIG
jgi:hypothetical protein